MYKVRKTWYASPTRTWSTLLSEFNSEGYSVGLDRQGYRLVIITITK